MKNHDQYIGSIGEEHAMEYVKKLGYIILDHHFTTHWGELDIVAKHLNTIYFIEVKTRVGCTRGKPYEAVGYYKLRSLRRAIQIYIQQHHYQRYLFSLDVASIILNEDFSVQSLQYYCNISA